MDGLFLRFPALRQLSQRPSVAAAFEFVLFVVAVIVFVATIEFKLRSVGPVALIAVSSLGAMLRLLPRGQAIRLICFCAATLFALALLRALADGPLEHRGQKLLLGLSALGGIALAIPQTLWNRLASVESHLAMNPFSRRAWCVAVFCVMLPVLILQYKSTFEVWTGDTIPVVPTVVQMLETSSRDLTPYLPPSGQRRWDAFGQGNAYFVKTVEGVPGVYSAYPAGMELFAWPMVGAAKLIGWDIHDDRIQQHFEKRTASVIAAVSLGLAFLIGCTFATPRAAWVMVAFLATGSVFTTTLGMLLWQQTGVVFWILVILAIERYPRTQKMTLVPILLQAFAAAAMLACRPSAVTFLVPFGIWLLLRDWRRGLLLPIFALIAYLPWAMVYFQIYGNLFGPAMGQLRDSWSPLANVGGVVFSPGRGLLTYQPWLMLLLLFPFVRPTTERSWHRFALAFVLLHVSLVASWPCWWGGACYGSRLVAEVVPVLGFVILTPIQVCLKSELGRWFLAGIFILGFVVHWPCSYHDAWLWNADPSTVDAVPARLWAWCEPPFGYHFFP